MVATPAGVRPRSDTSFVGVSKTRFGRLVKFAVGVARPGRTTSRILLRSSVVDCVVKTVMPAMSLAATRTLTQSVDGSTGLPPPVTAVRTTHAYVVFGFSGRPGSGRTESTFGM